MLIHHYNDLSAMRYADHSSVTASAADTFAIIAATLKAKEESCPPELHACYAYAGQEAIEGLAELTAQIDERDGLSLVATWTDQLELDDDDGHHADLDGISRLAALTCELLLGMVKRYPEPAAKLALLNAAANAGRIRDLTAA
ncbi:hypothetical protein [Microtetraspora sp. NBRC 16547]|uniref:hypothetical protein n=1 Tax=Microtetraspora sp. NBRC 16547 TaxID=3030993 RepID=UPI002552C84D|nr:hypothetical protein [Microtetraspora sp. NBRC 16547]